jgi:hypothetical protein
VTDFTTSWRDGLALCALVSRFAPGEINFAVLTANNEEEIRRNFKVCNALQRTIDALSDVTFCKLAFEVAERHGCPALLEVRFVLVRREPFSLPPTSCLLRWMT